MSTGYGLLSDPAYSGEVTLPVAPATSPISWPRMLVLDEETKERLSKWMFEEIHHARMEKQPLIDDWVKWQKQYWAKPKTDVKNWPFPRAANIVIPLTAISVEAVYARVMNTLFAVEPFFSVRPKSTLWIPVAPKFEEWFQTEIENPNQLDMWGFCAESLLELVKLGTGIGKSGYTREIRKTIKTYGDVDEPVWVETKNGATLDYVPVANFLIRLSENNPQTAPWVGEEHTFTWGQLKRMVLSGQLDKDAVEKIKTYWVSAREGTSGESDQYREEVDKLAEINPTWHEEFKVQEIWCSFDVDGDGVDEEIVLDYHYESQTILSIRYNWYDDLHRPYRIGNYVRVEGRIFGIGVGKQNEQFQEEITTIHRQRLDNATLANMGMVAVKKSSGYGPDEPIFPGKMWFLEDPKNDITPFKLSEVYNSAYANEQATMAYQEKRVGVNEVILGQPHEGTPGTATGDLTRLAEGNKRFDLVLRGIRRWLSQIGMDVAANYQQFGDQQRHWYVMGEEGQWIEQVLQMPPQLIRDGAIIEVTATDSVTNRDVEQRQLMAMMQLLERYYQGQIQLAAMLDPQLAAQIAQAALSASTEATKRLLETFNIVDAEKLLIGAQQNGGGPVPIEGGPALPPGPNGGPVGGVSPAAGQAGMAGLLTSVAETQGGETLGGGPFPRP